MSLVKWVAAAASAAVVTLSISVGDSVSVAESVQAQLDVLEVSVNDSIAIAESVDSQLSSYEVSVSDSIGVAEAINAKRYEWLGISSSHYDSHCGDNGSNTIEEALDGTDYWSHPVDHTHYVILDLGAQYDITRVRGRSYRSQDPIDVNIYISETNGNWGTAVATGISTWQDTQSWVEIDVTNKTGRYVKVEIVDTEDPTNFIYFGSVGGMTILDVYVAPLPSVSAFDTVAVTDAVNIIRYPLEASVNDYIAITDNVTVTRHPLEVSVYDSVAVTDTASATLSIYEASVSDSVSITEGVSAALSIYEISVNDSIAVTDYTNTSLTLTVSISDALSVTDSVPVELSLFEASVFDSLSITDATVISGDVLYVSIFDLVSISESLDHTILHGIAATIAAVSTFSAIAMRGGVASGVDEVVRNELQFPHIPDDVPENIKRILIELRTMLEQQLVGDVRVGGAIDIGGDIHARGILM